jgi:hypothetical protein
MIHHRDTESTELNSFETDLFPGRETTARKKPVLCVSVVKWNLRNLSHSKVKISNVCTNNHNASFHQWLGVRRYREALL